MGHITYCLLGLFSHGESFHSGLIPGIRNTIFRTYHKQQIQFTYWIF